MSGMTLLAKGGGAGETVGEGSGAGGTDAIAEVVAGVAAEAARGIAACRARIAACCAAAACQVIAHLTH